MQALHILKEVMDFSKDSKKTVTFLLLSCQKLDFVEEGQRYIVFHETRARSPLLVNGERALVLWNTL